MILQSGIPQTLTFLHSKTDSMNYLSTTAVFHLLVTFIFLSCSVAETGAGEELRPNVILIMTDDQGWGDVDFSQQLSPNPDNPNHATYPGHPELKTPELSEMAQAGLKLNRFYATCPVCSPTRCSFLTGRHYRRVLIDHANVGRLFNRELALPEVALSLGYATGHFGKWHLGTLDKSVHPIDSNRGGTDRANSPLLYSTPWNSGYQTTFCTESKTQTFNPTDISPLTHYWVGHEQPLAITDPSLNGDDSKVIMDRVIPFLQSAVNDNRPFFATVWFHTPHKPYDTIDNATLDEFYSPTEQAQMDDNEKGYYACLTAMDKQVGRLRDELQALGVESNTLLLFTSDNGPENGVPFVSTHATGDLRGNKRFLWEGGVRVPGLVVWPNQVAAGTTTDSVSGTIDLLPTLMDVWGVDMPDNRPLDGESILSVLRGSNNFRLDSMKWDFQGLRSIVEPDGRYKAISTNNGTSWQLYDLIADPKETSDLSNAMPTKTSQMAAEWNTWRTQVDAQRQNEIDYEDYIASSQNVILVDSSPPSFDAGKVAGSTAFLILEKQYATLESDLSVDADGSPATYNAGSPPSGATIPSETVVDSYLVHFDPAEITDASLSITFDNEILGVITGEQLLEASDDLSFANPSFYDSGSTGDLLRGLDLHNPDSIDEWTVSSDRRTIAVSLRSSGGTLDELRILTRAAAKPAVVVPDSIVVTQGILAVGTVQELDESDDQDFSIRRSTTDVQSRTEFEVKSTSPFSNASGIQLTVEGSVFARTNVVQTISLYDFLANSWEEVDTRPASRFIDNIVTVEVQGNVARFVESGTYCLRARFSFASENPRQQFTSNTDLINWTIFP